MPNDTHAIESLPAYALDCLDEAESQLIRQHLAGCYICRAELGSFQAVQAELTLLPLQSAAPPPELKSRLMQRIEKLQPTAVQPRPRSRSWFPQLQPVWGIAALLLILSLAVINLLLWQRVNQPQILTGPQGMRAITLHSTEVAPQASGIIIVGADGQNGVLVVDTMPQLDPEQQYQLWLIRDEESISGALFSVDESHYRGVRILAPESLLVYTAAQITIEPATGSAHPTGAIVMTGLLANP